MLVVIEGPDGAGKSTQVKMLKEYLRQRCGRLEYIHFPRYDALVYGDVIGSLLRGDFGKVNPKLIALLFAQDRRDAIPLIRERLDAGQTVLLDRYVYSNIAYQCSKVKDAAEAEELRDWILETEYEKFGLPRPDLNIFLDVPLDFVKSNLCKCRKGEDREYLAGGQDIHEQDLELQRRVLGLYRAQAARDPHFITVDCSDEAGSMCEPDEIFGRIRKVVDSFLGNGAAGDGMDK